MEWPLKVQGRLLAESDVSQIRDLLMKHPEWNRTRLSVELCHLWSWRRPDGQLKDMACREMLRKLEKRFLIALPSPLIIRRVVRRPPAAIDVELDKTHICGCLSDVRPVRMIDARMSKDWEKRFNFLMRNFHYLSFGRPVGQNMKYLFLGATDQILGGALFGAAAWKVEDRDRWIGWDAETRERNLGLVCNNTRFLIPAWVEVPHLASHILSMCLKRLPNDWFDRYGTAPVLVETFVDVSRFRGVCYKAANWRRVGQTKGRTRQDRYSQIQVPVKDIWTYPLKRDFRRFLLA